ILHHTDICRLSPYDLLQHTSDMDLTAQDFSAIYPLTIAVNTGAFTKRIATVDYPVIAVSQSNNSIITSCYCANNLPQLCANEVEVISCILAHKNYRIFFDKDMRRRLLLATAKDYGLENEPDLDIYFQVSYQEGKLDIQPVVKELLKLD